MSGLKDLEESEDELLKYSLSIHSIHIQNANKWSDYIV